MTIADPPGPRDSLAGSGTRGAWAAQRALGSSRAHGLLLLGLLALIYAPYVGRGGLLRDDFGFVTAPRDFSSYLDFQRHISSLLTMTARPVSAVAHGISYWIFAARAWAHHAVNVTLFAGSILLFYRAISRRLTPELAFVASALAAVYPSASGTVFSSMMMNSNLAALCWAGALVAATKPPSLIRDIAVTILLILSGLSYEAFAPLFVAVVFVARDGGRAGASRAWAIASRAAPLLAAMLLLAVYRVAVEPALFHTAFSRAKFPPVLLGRGASAIVGGFRVAVLDPFKLSARALHDLVLLTPGSAAITVLGALVMAAAIFAVARRHQARLTRGTWVAAFGLFLVAHLIYVFSDYHPTSGGFESRTQGGIRFAAAFLAAVTALWFHGARHQAGTDRSPTKLGRPWGEWIRPAALAAAFALFALGMVGQREGWIAAARYNDGVVERIGEALRGAGIDRADSITLVAQLGPTPHDLVNGEPVFGTSWDLGPALELAHPSKRIRANVYEPKRTRVDSSGVTIDGNWKASFPFILYRDDVRGELVLIQSLDDWGQRGAGRGTRLWPRNVRAARMRSWSVAP